VTKLLRRLSTRAILSVTLLGAAFGALSNRPSLDELWMSDGYGLLVEIRGDSLRVFETTSISCLPSAKGARQLSATIDDGAVFKIDGDLVRFLPGASADDARLHFEGAASDIQLHRTAAKPDACSQQPENTLQSNYAIFWQTFAEHYPFFDLRHVDWQAVDKQFRPQVTPATNPRELFRHFSADDRAAQGYAHRGRRTPPQADL
jgi:tricorn protease-like protein